MKISWDIIFLIAIGLLILFCYCSCNNKENFDNIVNADIEAIRNLNSIATKLTAGQLTSPGPLSVTGDLNIGPNNKFKFNPGGDNWVRLFNANNSHADQGFAATRLWTQNLHGKPTIVDGIAGNLNVDGDVNLPNGKTIAGAGRMHISAGELLYLLPKNGVMITGDWGGNGNLTVTGALNVQGRNILAELDALKANTIKVNDRIRINGDQGMLGACGWSPCGGMQAAVWTGDASRAGMSIGRG